MEGLANIEEFIQTPDELLDYLTQNVVWDERMAARKTASYGVAYNYSQMSYPFQSMLPLLKQTCIELNGILGFEPNNCLINYYINGKSKMGFHSDKIDILEPTTGIAIISLGATRTLRFRNIENKDQLVDFELLSGSLLYMTQNVQEVWEHSLLKSAVDTPRMSLTFRRIIS